MTRRLLATALAALAALATPRAAAAAEYHVDASSPAARDANPGTAKAPLRTISAGLAKAMPGDVVSVRSGTYREFLHFPRGGASAEKRIVLAAAPGADVVVKGSDVVTEWAPSSGGVWTAAWAVNSQQVFVDGAPLRQIGVTCPFNELKWGKEPILQAKGRGVADLTPGSFFYDAKRATLHVRLPGDANPNAHVVEASVRHHVVVTAVSFVELRGLKFAHSNTSAIPRLMGIVNVEGNGWLISGCSFTHGDFAGLSLSGAGHRVIGNACNDNGDVGIVINGSDAAHGWAPYEGRPPQDIVLEGNETSRNNYRGFYYYFQAGGLKASNSCNGIRLSRHTAIANVGPGVWFDLGCHDVTIERSVLRDNTRGVEYEISGRALITGNVVEGNSMQGIYVSASNDVTVANNTVDDNGWGVVVHGLPRAEHPELRNNAILDNVIADSRIADLVVYERSPQASGNRSDGNLYFRQDGRVRISWARDSQHDLSHVDLRAFAGATGRDARSAIGDPRWVDRSAGDYRLREGSPAAGKGAFPDPLRGAGTAAARTSGGGSGSR